MTPQEILLELTLRAVVLATPVTVGIVAFRRLLMSRTVNRWVYALAVGYAAFAAVGLVPWSMGVAPFSAGLFGVAMLSPLLWLAIVVVCGIGRPGGYLARDDDARAPAPLETLVLKDPLTPEPPSVPLFRHHEKTFGTADGAERHHSLVLDAARGMRGRSTSEARRIRRLLPPPSPDVSELPFLR